jgi:NitT/TauT family transport system substrate-binding protein
MVLNTLGKKIETICQFGIAPGEAEVVDSSLTNISSPKDLGGKNLGVTDIGSGTHVLTQAILGTAGLDPTKSQYVAVGAGDTFIAAIQQHKIAAGMTTYPTISRLVNSGKGKILVSLLTPADTRAALGGDYPFIGVFAKNDWVNSNKDVAQRLVNAYVKTLKFMHSHTAAEIADKMPADYYAGDKASYVSDLQSQLSIFGTDCKMPAGGPETVQKIQQQFVASYKGKSANLSETYTNEFADKAS